MVDWPFNAAIAQTSTLIGSDDANNSQATTNVVPNPDGSMLERQEYMQALLAGTFGLASFPAGASPANDVSLAEVIRAIWGILNGTASGENGVATWPTAAVYGNNVSLAEVIAWIMDGVRRGTGTALATNESLADILYATNGIATFPSAAVPANSASLAAVLRENYNQSERGIASSAAVLATGTTIFTVAGGPILIKQLLSICQVGADSTAATLQWSADGTLGSATTFTAASASRANQAAGDAIVCNFTALNTAPDLVANGVGLGPVIARTGIHVPAGIITTTIGSGPTTTGTYIHYMRYAPMSRGVTVTAS
jgi:hypothetical protein